jgi:hypothetical protein
MRLIIILLTVLLLVYLVRKGVKENFNSFNILKYPDIDIETHETWIKYHANDTLLKKRQIVRYMKLLKNEINLFFYSKNLMKLCKCITISRLMKKWNILFVYYKNF